MKILFLNYEFPPIGGGGANANRQLFREFSRIPGIEIDCVTSNMGEEDLVVEFAPNITLHRLAVSKTELHFWTQREVLTYLLRAHRYINARLPLDRYDLCHAFFGFPSGFLAYVRHRTLPYVISLRGSDVPGFNPRFSWQYVLLKPLFRRIWRHARAVVANSRGLCSLAQEFEPDQEIRIITNGIDTDEFSPDPSSIEPNHFLCVSRLIERKGVHHLLDAFAEVSSEIGNARLTIVGEGNMAKQLRAQVAELGIGDRVTFLGYVPHEKLAGIYRRAQIYVQPSYFEGMSNTVLEAMATGLPILATATGGADELLRDNAERVEFAEPRQLARTLMEMSSDADLLKRKGIRSREIAVQFSWSQIANEYVQTYREIAEIDGPL